MKSIISTIRGFALKNADAAEADRLAAERLARLLWLKLTIREYEAEVENLKADLTIYADSRLDRFGEDGRLVLPTGYLKAVLQKPKLVEAGTRRALDANEREKLAQHLPPNLMRLDVHLLKLSMMTPEKRQALLEKCNCELVQEARYDARPLPAKEDRG